MIHPASPKRNKTCLILSAQTFFNSISPFVIAAPQRNVPASILSGDTVYSAPCNSCTPSIDIHSVPAPFIFAPHKFKNVCSSTISGSQAALYIVV